MKSLKGGTVMIIKPLTPAPPKRSQYGVDPEFVTKRGAELEGITSVLLRELIPDLPPLIYPNGG